MIFIHYFSGERGGIVPVRETFQGRGRCRNRTCTYSYHTMTEEVRAGGNREAETSIENAARVEAIHAGL